MKIGIIVHSQTGNTYSVAQKLQERLLSTGHSVNLERLIPVDEKQGIAKNIQLKAIPDLTKYDVLVFGAPVRGASISPVLDAYLTQVASLQGKKVACFVTQFFPYRWMGGNRAISQMKKIFESKGATVFGTGIVNWKNSHREEMITDVVEKLSISF